MAKETHKIKLVIKLTGHVTCYYAIIPFFQEILMI